MNHYQHQAPIGGSHQDMMQHHGHHHDGHHNHHDHHAHHDPHAHNHASHHHAHHQGHNHEHNAHNAHNHAAAAADHSHHHHDAHAHSHHHGSSPGEAQCSMNMLLNFSTKDLCIFTHHLRIPDDSWPLWAAGLAFVFLFVAGYEGFKARARSFDRWVAAEFRRLSLDAQGAGGGGSRSSSSKLEPKTPAAARATATATAQSFARSQKPRRALLHAGTYLYGMLAMLLFMTYNVQVMLACTAGAGAGFLRWAGDVPGLATGGSGGSGSAVRGPGQQQQLEDVGEEEEQSAACH